ncbi:hypothetical protein O181_065959 [Austropuccinia psidii MF-1]|uniref:Uncharacterized protein n=1 Tax=Austropuccinia psidii MF-1 TaxID=1389203 RepID=A0A9Q3ES27_9BASI|nr:hypothetical protein [Austropuccinia psidii MF-1]
MTNSNTEKDVLTIPVLDGTSYRKWGLGIPIFLRSKELLHFCEKEPEPGISTATNLWNKASYNGVNLISARVSHEVFNKVIKLNKRNYYPLGTKLKKKQHSTISNSKPKIILELESVGILLAPELLSFTTLGKLMGDPKVHQYVELLTLNEDLVGNPDEVLSKLEDFHNNSILQESQPKPLASSLI